MRTAGLRNRQVPRRMRRECARLRCERVIAASDHGCVVRGARTVFPCEDVRHVSSSVLRLPNSRSLYAASATGKFPETRRNTWMENPTKQDVFAEKHGILRDRRVSVAPMMDWIDGSHLAR
jgi:hypothetical protein